MKVFFFLVRSVGIVSVLFFINLTFIAEAESVQSIETESSLSFYGIYESEIEPKPGPPDGSKPVELDEAKKKTIQGKLPQMGELVTQNLIWLIIALLGIILFERHRIYRKQLRAEINHQ